MTEGSCKDLSTPQAFDDSGSLGQRVHYQAVSKPYILLVGLFVILEESSNLLSRVLVHVRLGQIRVYSPKRWTATMSVRHTPKLETGMTYSLLRTIITLEHDVSSQFMHTYETLSSIQTS